MSARSDVAATAILVLGMHRSGTSAVARMLNLSGADLGRDLLPPKQDNERGFWENSALLELHERFLDEAGLHWYDLASLPEGWRDGAAARHFVAALPEVLTQQFGDSSLFLIKDPRLSLLAPLWIEVLERRAVRPVFVITIRHPDEVAASLAKRDGFSYARSHLLWLQHLLEAEHATRGHRRVFVHYERVLADWPAELARIASAFGLTWPNAGADSDEQISAFITPSLRHHGGDAREAAAPMPAIVQEAYAIASSAAAGSSPPSAFDGVALAFENALRVAGPLIHDLCNQLAQGSQSHAQEIDRARATIDDLAARIAEAREAHESRDRLESDLRGKIDALSAEIEMAREGFAAKEREIDAARDNINTLAMDLERAAEVIALKDREIDAARHSIDGFIDELARARSVIAAKDGEIDNARRNIDALVAGLAAKDTELDRARAGLAAKDAELDAARSNIDALVAEIGRAREAHAARDAVEAALRAELAALRGSRWFRLGRKLGLIDRKRP